MKKRSIVKWLMVMHMSLALTGCGRMDIEIPEDGITVELGSELSEDVSEYVTAKEYEDLSIHTETIDTFTVGTYTASVYYKDKEAGTFPVSVVDTTAPEAAMEENIRIENGQKCTVDDCVKEITDLSEAEAWFMVDSLQLQGESEPEHNFDESNLSKYVSTSENGAYQINIFVRDIHENYNVYQFLFEVYTPDTEAPVITAEDKAVEYGKTPDYMADVSAVDNVDGDLTEKLEVDASQVNVNKAGKYAVIYSVSDEAGNQGTKEIMVTVKEKKIQPMQTAAAPAYQVTGNIPSPTCPITKRNDAVIPVPEQNPNNESADCNSDAVIVQPEQQPVIPETPVSTAEFDSGKADELLALVNAERQARGIGGVAAKESLTEKAKERAKAGNGGGSGVILCRGTGATSASIVVDSWNRDWPDGTWMTEAWKYAGAACYNDGGTYTWVVVFGAY